MPKNDVFFLGVYWGGITCHCFAAYSFVLFRESLRIIIKATVVFFYRYFGNDHVVFSVFLFVFLSLIFNLLEYHHFFLSSYF